MGAYIDASGENNTSAGYDLSLPVTASPRQSQRSSSMKLRPRPIEFLAITGFVLLGAILRFTNLNLEAVEHFDEGIYASPLWYDTQFGEPYPSRHLFAPPLLSTMMEGWTWVPGLAPYAAFLPSVLLGTATIFGLWWLARSWFGKSAGIFMAATVAMSDFHILYSRMALTDVACLFWIVMSVGFGTQAIARQNFKSAAIAGFLCGLAWWTKYTGWLPLAILCSGAGFWWIWQGRRSMGFIRFVGIIATMIAVALGTFAPWWWQLRAVGGYEAVSETHEKYVTGWSNWSANMAQQLRDQFLLDGYTGQLSLGLGLFLAGLFRWTSGRSTWNAAAIKSNTAGGESDSAVAMTLPPFALLLRFAAAAIALSVIAMRLRTPLMLICISLAGLSGIYLWPVLQRAWTRRNQRDVSPTSTGAIPLSITDLENAPTIDPALGFSITLAWFTGMLLATPMYTPYSRLFFPLLAAIWLAAAGGISWWLESNLSVARRIVGTGEPAPKLSWGQRLVATMLGVALLASFFQFDENFELGFVQRSELFQSSLFEDRRSIVSAADVIAEACVRDALDEGANADGANNATHELPSGIDPNSITPSALIAAAAKAEASASESPSRDADANLASTTPEERSQIRMVIYVFGEPALLFQLHQAGVMVAPVSHLNLRGPDGTPPTVPTFLVFGPNAKRTDGFWEDLMSHSDHLRPVDRIYYFPSAVSLLDMFDPTWLREHPEASMQSLEVHRVQ